jgi:hypothetical protein
MERKTGLTIIGGLLILICGTVLTNSLFPFRFGVLVGIILLGTAFLEFILE